MNLYCRMNYTNLIHRAVVHARVRYFSLQVLPSHASHLLNGLDVHQVTADDGHALAVYGVDSSEYSVDKEAPRRPILLLHGRTWSSVPVYHLLGGDNRIRYKQPHSRSLMEMLYKAGLLPFAMDFRGFGGTKPDSSGVVVPNRCVKDVECVLEFLNNKLSTLENKVNADTSTPTHLPALLGWSQGALIAQLAAQKSPHLISRLILYGSIYDPSVRYPRTPLYLNLGDDDQNITPKENKSPPRQNTFHDAIEDFTVEGSIPPEPARLFAQTALLTDPIKASWTQLCQFNNLDPARVHIPTLVIAGDQDPYAPLRIQADLFTNLGRGADRTWSIIADADHAIHLLDGGRDRFVHAVKHFVNHGNRGSMKTHNTNSC